MIEDVEKRVFCRTLQCPYSVSWVLSCVLSCVVVQIKAEFQVCIGHFRLLSRSLQR